MQLVNLVNQTEGINTLFCWVKPQKVADLPADQLDTTQPTMIHTEWETQITEKENWYSASSRRQVPWSLKTYATCLHSAGEATKAGWESPRTRQKHGSRPVAWSCATVLMIRTDLQPRYITSDGTKGFWTSRFPQPGAELQQTTNKLRSEQGIENARGRGGSGANCCDSWGSK